MMIIIIIIIICLENMVSFQDNNYTTWNLQIRWNIFNTLIFFYKHTSETTLR